MLGADISFLPELEAKGIKFSENGVEKDAIQSLKDRGFNYVCLRIFPATDSGYSPGKDFCDLTHTLQMAKRVKASGMKLLLDFHYSDYWGDPGHQIKPAAWKNFDFEQMKQALYDYTKHEINHGINWPGGNVSSIDGLAQLVNA